MPLADISDKELKDSEHLPDHEDTQMKEAKVQMIFFLLNNIPPPQ
jgi:hypothetical protein